MTKADIVRRLGEELGLAQVKQDMYSKDNSRAGFVLEQHYAGKAEAYRLALSMIEQIDDFLIVESPKYRQ